MGLFVIQGLRPSKPENASSIGLSDSLWSFVQRCWDGTSELRPKIVEVVKHLGREAADWDGLMPPCGSAVYASEEPMSNTLEYREFAVLIFPWCCSLSNYTGSILPPSISPAHSELYMFTLPRNHPLRGDTGGIFQSPSELVPSLNSPPLDLAGIDDESQRSPDQDQFGDPNNSTEAAPRSPLEPSPLPALPQAPANFFPREEIVNDILDLTDQVASTALFGSIGVGKSFLALRLLHHNRTRVKFGRNRHFMRCDNLSNSLEGFLERLSDAIGIDRTTDIGKLRLHLESSPPLILLLDGVDHVLDPLVTEAEEISATIEEFGGYQHLCLLTTSRMCPEISGFHRVDVPTLSERDARDAFYGICHLDRSPVVDNLIARLDFHPLAIDLFATAVRENWWDELTLLKVWDEMALPKVWDGDQNGVLKTQYQQILKGAVGPSFRSPTIQNMGATALEILGGIAASPRGIEERRLESTFPNITGVRVAVDVLCKFSLLYRQDGFVKMLSPFRFYFMDSILEPVQHVEAISWGVDNRSPVEAGRSLSHRPCWSQGNAF